MTDEQLERAARRYCELAGIEPDGPAQFWRGIADVLRIRWMELEAISDAINEAKP